jgi:hypothetical protein
VGRWKSAIQPLRTAFRLSPHEARNEIMNLIVDAVFAAATNDLRLGESGSSDGRYKDLLWHISHFPGIFSSVEMSRHSSPKRSVPP